MVRFVVVLLLLLLCLPPPPGCCGCCLVEMTPDLGKYRSVTVVSNGLATILDDDDDVAVVVVWVFCGTMTRLDGANKGGDDDNDNDGVFGGCTSFDKPNDSIYASWFQTNNSPHKRCNSLCACLVCAVVCLCFSFRPHPLGYIQKKCERLVAGSSKTIYIHLRNCIFVY